MNSLSRIRTVIAQELGIAATSKDNGPANMPYSYDICGCTFRNDSGTRIFTRVPLSFLQYQLLSLTTRTHYFFFSAVSTNCSSSACFFSIST